MLTSSTCPICMNKTFKIWMIRIEHHTHARHNKYNTLKCRDFLLSLTVKRLIVSRSEYYAKSCHLSRSRFFLSSSHRFEYEMVLRWCSFSKAQITKCIAHMKIDEFTFGLTIPDRLRRNQFFIGLKCTIVIIIILMVVFVGRSWSKINHATWCFVYIFYDL